MSASGQTHDFGRGPVPAHRHRNPDGTTGGWVAATARVADTAHIGPQAKVYGTAQVRAEASLMELMKYGDNR